MKDRQEYQQRALPGNPKNIIAISRSPPCSLLPVAPALNIHFYSTRPRSNSPTAQHSTRATVHER
jgi:hypothetical protein